MTLDERGHVAVVRPAQQIAFPMTGNGSVFDLGRPFVDGNRIDDLPACVSVNTGVPRAADAPFGSQMSHQLLFQRPARL
jgi:hypothetical protein